MRSWQYRKCLISRSTFSNFSLYIKRVYEKLTIAEMSYFTIYIFKPFRVWHASWTSKGSTHTDPVSPTWIRHRSSPPPTTNPAKHHSPASLRAFLCVVIVLNVVTLRKMRKNNKDKSNLLCRLKKYVFNFKNLRCTWDVYACGILRASGSTLEAS